LDAGGHSVKRTVDGKFKGPMRGLTFSVVAPALGVVAVLGLLAFRQCTSPPNELSELPAGTLERRASSSPESL
jgi:hypothetical protein